jgi:inhibitor of growth protein 3
VSPTDSLASASAFTGKPIEPRTARQLAAAANRAARKIEDYADSDDDGESDSGNAPADEKNGLELALGETSGHSRESTSGGKANAGPTAGNAKGNGRGRAGGSNKRPLDPDGFSLESSDEDAKNWKAPPKKVPKGTVATNQHVAPDGDGDADMDQDASPYCICHGPSYGEMIGCDNDNCEIEWVSSTSTLVQFMTSADDIVPYQLSRIVTPTRGRVDLSSVYGETRQASEQEARFQSKGEKVIFARCRHVV